MAWRTRSILLRTILWLPLAMLLLAPPTRAHAQTPPNRLLATEFIRVALGRLNDPLLTVEAINTSILLANQAVELDPDNAELWTLMFDLALLAERDDLKQRAAEQVSRLLPGHEVVQFARLNDALDRLDTFEQKEAAYERLLDPANRDRIGPAIASRLALDLALLYQRQDDVHKFTQWLSEAVKIDPSNRTAAAIATGFFRLNVSDPVAEAELLVNLLIADPTDITTQVVLAQLLLEHGAFGSAERFYSMAVRATTATGRLATNNLIADLAIAQWARGDAVKALETLRQRQAQLDAIYRAQMAQQNQELTPEQRRTLTAPADPNLASVEAAIRMHAGDEQASQAADAALAAYQQAIRQAHERMNQPPDPQQPQANRVDPAALARVHLEAAWLIVWFGLDVEAQPFLDHAEQLQPLSDVAKTRFQGWLAYRRGELDHAEQLLRSVAEQDVAARLGLAQTLHEQGSLRDAAREYLAVHREQPGSLIGVWAGKKLEALLKRPLPPAEHAQALERLVGSISRQFDLAVDDPSLAISLRVIPTKLNYAAYEPVLFDLELTNNSIYPLALDRDGPIRPQVMLVTTVRGADAPGLGELAPFVVNIGQRLRLMPREKVTVRVDLRNHRPGDVINALALHGSIVRIKALVNFSITAQGTAFAGLYGVEVDAPLIRIDGVRATEQWLTGMMESMSTPQTPGVLEQMALLAFRIASRPPQNLAPEAREVINRLRIGLAEAYAKLDPVAQAWLLAVMPRGYGAATEGIQAVITQAQQSPHRLVQMMYLIFRTMGSTDPMIDAARRSDDPLVRELAQYVHAHLQRLEQAEAEANSQGQGR